MTQMTTLSPDKILQLGSAFWGSKTLLSAIELGLFTQLAIKGPLGLAELREALGLHERDSRDFFDALVALGMLQRLPDGRYANTPETELYLDRNKPSYCGGMLEMMNARLYSSGVTSPRRFRPACRKTRAGTANLTSSVCSIRNRPGLSCSCRP